METLSAIINTLLPLIIMGFFIYFSLLLGSIIISMLRVKKQDKTLSLCMNKAGLVFYGILAALYIGLLVYSVYFFILGLSQVKGLADFIGNFKFFNALTVYTMVLSLLLQDFALVGKRAMLLGNRMFEYRRIKKVTYPKKHKCQFVYGQKTINVSTWFLDITKFKKNLAK